jgi:integrase
MARPSSGWKLRPPRDKCGSYTVRFWWRGRDIERSTGTADPERAASEAARIYAREVSRPEQRRPAQVRAVGELEESVTRWLDSLIPTHDAGTVGCYLDYARSHWFPFFPGMHSLTDAECDRYMRARLSAVQATTVKKELSALRGFTSWATAKRLIGPVVVPTVPKRSTGATYRNENGETVRRRAAAIPISPKEARAILAGLDEWSTSKKVAEFPIRARFEVQYETGLRPELIDLLSVPEHYRKRATHLRIPGELDKARQARRVPLSAAARKALDRICPEKGLIFGHHDYREHLKLAAADVLPAERAELFCGAHLRSARITHWLDEGAPLTGVMRLVGHTRLETTAKYVRASDKIAEQIVAPKRRRR